MRLLVLSLALASIAAGTQAPEPQWPAVETETLEHFQSLLRMDTSDPPGNEAPAVEYLKQVLEKEGIPVETFALEGHASESGGTAQGLGRKRPLLIMGHTDVVNVDAKKWTFPPFSATRDGGYVYGRGAVDDKDNVTAGLMVMLTLKRLRVPLDRDVIFLAESGEEGTTRVGIQFMANQNFDKIDAEYCLAEGGNVSRSGGKVKFASVQTLEKIPYAVDLTARGPAGHGSVPLQGNAIAHLSKAVAALAALAVADPAQRHDTGVFRAAGVHLDSRRSRALSRCPRCGYRQGVGRLLRPARAAARLDAAHARSRPTSLPAVTAST